MTTAAQTLLTVVDAAINICCGTSCFIVGPYTLQPVQDVWSFAAVLYAILFADLPWAMARHDDPDFRAFVRLGMREDMAPWCLLSRPLKVIFLALWPRVQFLNCNWLFLYKPPVRRSGEHENEAID